MRLELSQGPVDKMHGNRAFAHSGGHALHVPGANVTNREDSRKAGFQHLRRTGERPGGRWNQTRGRIQIAPREDESFVVESDTAPEPLGSWGCSRHDKHV